MCRIATPEFDNARNGKIHRYPLRACKLLCFTKDTYKRIVRAVKGLTEKGLAPSLLKKQKSAKRPGRVHSYKHVISAYQPTRIWSVHNSDYWKWRRVKAWFEEFKEEYGVR